MAWVKGQSGNPAGRPRGKTLAEQCRENSGRVINRLLHWLEQDENPSASIRAAEILLDRAYGKPVLPLADGNGQAALELDLSDLSSSELLRYEKTLQELILLSVNVVDDEDESPSDS